MEDIAVIIKDLWVRLGGRLVLEDVNLEILEKDFLGLIGPNGGGKSTLLKVILGLIKPERGTVRVFGLEPAEARRLIGYLPQRSLFDQSFPITAFEVVLMGRYGRVGILRRYSADDREAAMRALETMNMEEYANREIGAFSGGEQQRILVARALVSEPRLLLLDEPTSGIDVSKQTVFYELLRSLNRDMAIVMVSHDISAVSIYVDKIACLNRRLFYHGSKQLTECALIKAYGYPVEVIADGTPHRILKEHD